MPDNIFVYIIVVLIVLVLAMWGVSVLPLPADPYIVRALFYFLCIAIAGYAIARKAKLL